MLREETGVLRMGELSRRVGVSHHVLRGWEARYGLLTPVRCAAQAVLDRLLPAFTLATTLRDVVTAPHLEHRRHGHLRIASCSLR